MKRLGLSDVLTNSSGSAAVGATGIQGATGIGSTATITNWTAYTPTGSWTTNTTYTGMYRRVGDSLDLRLRVMLSGPPDANILAIDLPSS